MITPGARCAPPTAAPMACPILCPSQGYRKRPKNSRPTHLAPGSKVQILRKNGVSALTSTYQLQPSISTESDATFALQAHCKKGPSRGIAHFHPNFQKSNRATPYLPHNLSYITFCPIAFLPTLSSQPAPCPAYGARTHRAAQHSTAHTAQRSAHPGPCSCCSQWRVGDARSRMRPDATAPACTHAGAVSTYS